MTPAPGILSIPWRLRLHPRFWLGRLLPHARAVCGHANADAYVCRQCEDTLPVLAPGCPVCAHPLPQPPLGQGKPSQLPCGSCLSHPPAYDASRARYRYGAPVDALIHALKYHRRLASADFLGARLPGHDGWPAIDQVVPVPLSRQRLAERGYNQAYQLAVTYCRQHALRLAPDLVRRHRHTPAQVGLPWRERVGNLRGAFECTARIDGHHILVIDDVMTSGSTLNEIALTLKAAGATRVSTIVVARAVRDSA